MASRSKRKSKQSTKNFHLFNCDKTCNLDQVKSLLRAVEGEVDFKIKRVEQPFKLGEIATLVDKTIPQMKMDYAVFMVHAKDHDMFKDNCYGKVYNALKQTAGSGEKVLVVIAEDENYENEVEEERELISHSALKNFKSQFRLEFVDGRKSFVFSWNKKHRPIHEEALQHFFDPSKKGKKFEHQPRQPMENVPAVSRQKSFESATVDTSLKRTAVTEKVLEKPADSSEERRPRDNIVCNPQPTVDEARQPTAPGIVLATWQLFKFMAFNRGSYENPAYDHLAATNQQPVETYETVPEINVTYANNLSKVDLQQPLGGSNEELQGEKDVEQITGDLPVDIKDNSPWEHASISSNIVTSEGGVLVIDCVKLVWPTGAVDNAVSVNMTLEDPSKYYGLVVQKDLENDVMFAAPIINLEPSGHLFKKPLTLVTKFKVENFKWDDVFILHGSKARDGKITWQDITFNSKIDEANVEVIIEIEHFSLVAVLVRFCRSTLIRTKEIISRLNLLAFNYTLSVLLNKCSPSSVHDELAILFVSQDVYHEQFYREDETSSALMQLKKEGFVELHVCSITRQEEKSIYNNENLQINVHLGEDYNLADRQQEKTSFTVHSYVWWNAGMVIRLPLKWKKDVRRLCGKISVQGEYGHTSERHFSEGDLCGYVRSLLGVEGTIFNLIPIAQLLEMPEESTNEVAKCWKDEDEQLELILQHWSKENDVVEDLAALRKHLESLQQKDYMLTNRGQMHIRHLRKRAAKISGLQCVNADSVNYFVRKIQTLCKSVLRDCCIELEGSIEDVYRAASSESYAEFLIHSIEIHRLLSEDIARKYQQVCSSSEKAIIKTFLTIVPHLIQNIKDIFVDERISEVPQNGLRGLPKKELDDFVSCVRNAEEHNRCNVLVCESCDILKQLCLKNHDKQPIAEIEIWGDTAGIHPMLNFVMPFFQHCRQDVRLHQRLDLFSRREKDIIANHEDIDEVFVHDLSNLLLSLIHFAKFDPSKLVRYELNDSTNVPLTCFRENVSYDEDENTYSQVFRVKKESKGELQLHAIARVYISGKICTKGTFQSEIMLNVSSEEAFHECSNRFDDVTVVKLKDNDSENLRVVLCSTQKEKLSELLDVLKHELRAENVDLNQSEVTQCYLTMRTVTTNAGAVVNLRLVYKWGSDAVFLDSKDFVTFADLSTGCLCTPEVQVVDLSKERILDYQQLTLTADKQPEDGSTIRENNVASHDMQILIKMMNETTIALAVKPKDLILNVKKKVQQLNECPPDRQRLVFAGKKLEDDHTLSDYNVQNGSTLSLVQRLRDPAPLEDAS